MPNSTSHDINWAKAVIVVLLRENWSRQLVSTCPLNRLFSHISYISATLICLKVSKLLVCSTWFRKLWVAWNHRVHISKVNFVSKHCCSGSSCFFRFIFTYRTFFAVAFAKGSLDFVSCSHRMIILTDYNVMVGCGSHPLCTHKRPHRNSLRMCTRNILHM